jgi:CBS-domain-containing membrane protein
LVVLDDTKAKGVLTSVQLLTALASGDDMNGELCGAHMDMDVMEVNLSDELEDLNPELSARKPHAILAVDDAGDFAGYFSPNDYREALQMGD